MRTEIYLVIAIVATICIVLRRRVRPIREFGTIDAIVPAFNEERCIVDSVERLLQNPYLNQIFVVNDGSTDATPALIDLLAVQHSRLTVIHQENTGKGAALMAGITRSEAEFVFLTDADTTLPSTGDGLGYMLAEMNNGADAVGGIPLSDLRGAGLLPHIRASTKLIIISLHRTFQQLLGGAPFLISGACGLFRREMLVRVPFNDRTKVEDLDLTWSLIANGYKIRQCNRSVVYSQECNTLKAELNRWRRWIAGYAVCMRLHRQLLRTRFGLLTVIPVALSPFIAVGFLTHALEPVVLHNDWVHLPLYLFPFQWMVAVYVIGAVGAIHHRRASLIFLAPAALVYVLICYFVWLSHGLRGLFTGKEPQREKPERYAHVVA